MTEDVRIAVVEISGPGRNLLNPCLLYTSDAADDLLCVDLGGRRIIKKKKNTTHTTAHNTLPQSHKTSQLVHTRIP